jgi:hypothetical protein
MTWAKLLSFDVCLPVFFTCCLVLSSCSGNKLKAGTYEFENPKVKCDIILLDDKSFQQTVFVKKTGATLKLDGNWNQVERGVSMSPFFYSIDPNTGEPIDNPVRLETADGEVSGGCIIFNVVSHYEFYLK